MSQAEAALNNWAQWSAGLKHKPTVLKSLGAGRSNRSLLLDSDVGKLVLRLNAQDTLLPGESRGHESEIWQAASHAGIAPSLLYYDEQAGYLVSRYIENELSVNPQSDHVIANQALDLLGRCHQLQLDVPSIDYADHIERYWRRIESKNISVRPELIEQRIPMQLVLETLYSRGTETGLCHHDPVVANFVGSAENLYLIDWEYAANGLQIMDYAALGVEWSIDDSELIIQTGIEQDLLLMAKSLYRYLCDLWGEQNPESHPG
jgi:thiamine kinase